MDTRITHVDRQNCSKLSLPYKVRHGVKIWYNCTYMLLLIYSMYYDNLSGLLCLLFGFSKRSDFARVTSEFLLLKNKNYIWFFSLFVYSLFNKGCLVAIDCTCTSTFLNILLNNPRSLFKGGKHGKVMFTKITRVDEFQRTRFGQSSHLLLKIVCAQLCSLLYSQFLKIILAHYGSSFMKNFK